MNNQWRQIQARLGDSSHHKVWISNVWEDTLWDCFLTSTSTGQFQQSSAWARVKRVDGWLAKRWIVTNEGGLPEAGFQILWRRKGPLKFGYLNRGPVRAPTCSLGWNQLLTLAFQAAKSMRLALLVIEAPDLAEGLEKAMDDTGCCVHDGPSLISASVWIKLDQSLAEIENRISKNVLRQIRKSRSSDIKFTHTGAQRADLFFELMRETCRRQGVSPNPSTSAAISSIINEFSSLSALTSKASVSILEASLAGQVCAASLLIRFGDRLTEWKKGWRSSNNATTPNKALVYEGILSGLEARCAIYDFVGISRRTAEHVLSGGSISDGSIPGPDEFKLHFGGEPRLLPRARLWAPNALFRSALMLYCRALRSKAMNR